MSRQLKHSSPNNMERAIYKNEIADTKMFYGSIGVAASLAFFLLLYWGLSFNSTNITMLIQNTKDQPLYLWLYAILTLLAIVLFGVSTSLLVYRSRKFGLPKLKSQGGAGLGSFVGFAASACPVCGSTVLTALGIAGGLAAFPLGGLELKALSVGLLALPIGLTYRDMKKLECLPAVAPAQAGVSAQAGGDEICPVPKDASFKETDRPWLIGLFGLIAVLSFVSWQMLRAEPVIAKLVETKDSRLLGATQGEAGNKLFYEVSAKVLPDKGFQSKIKLGDSIVKLTEQGVIDQEKFEAIYKGRGELPAELKDVLTKPSDTPILLTKDNAGYYVNLLWPVGLSNYMSSNGRSPVNANGGADLFGFASTGGWTLGKEKNGGAYFNKFTIVSLTPEQEALVTKIAENTYRPCCNNSTFFQDCNHGSALLGLLELGASQGLSESDLYREALAFNSFWFPQNYIETALYFKAVKNMDWENVDPKVVMGKDFSTASGWSANVQAEIAKIPNLIPKTGSGAGCGV